MTEEYIIETENLTKIYGDGAQVYALNGISLQIKKGEFFTVMGPSGSGKSTLLNMLGALDRPSKGRVLINGQDLARIKNLDYFRARTVGFIFQMHNLIPTLNARENVEVPLRGLNVGRRERRRRAEELLELVGMGDRLRHLPNQLSGGERQRVAIARSLANRPELVLADEPTGNLDSESGAVVIELLDTLNRELGTTLIIVTHDPVVARETRRVVTLQDGKIADDHQVGHPYEEDLQEFRESGLWQAFISGNGDVEQVLGELTVQERQTLQRVLGR
ncbi:MAG TPA: ABC transporter ATP-binding protein [Thermoflexia bacterium]|nr:ABC transporter ATP-binding protein [Thermoflexia bacterium]